MGRGFAIGIRAAPALAATHASRGNFQVADHTPNCGSVEFFPVWAFYCLLPLEGPDLMVGSSFVIAAFAASATETGCANVLL